MRSRTDSNRTRNRVSTEYFPIAAEIVKETRFLNSHVLSTTTVQEIMNWEMMVFRESPLGQDMMKQEAQRMLLRLLQYRFGEVPESVEATLQGLKTDELEELGEALFRVNSLEEFIGFLPVAAANGSAT